jgi:hypothetical protein
MDTRPSATGDAERARVRGLFRRKKLESTIPNIADLAQVADTLSQNEIAGRLLQVCERWIYTTCLCFALDLI